MALLRGGENVLTIREKSGLVHNAFFICPDCKVKILSASRTDRNEGIAVAGMREGAAEHMRTEHLVYQYPLHPNAGLPNAELMLS